MPTDHWMQFATFAEQRHFVYPTADTYCGVVLNANMVAHAPNGIAGFILEKKGPESVYVIDPLTHAFQHDPGFIVNSDGKPKSSIRSLAESYGKPLIDIVGQRPVLPKDFSDESTIKSFTKNVVEFQSKYLSEFMLDSGVAKYLDDDEGSPPPYAIVAPYFFFTETTIDQWIDIYRKCASYAQAIVKSDGRSKLFLAMVVSQGVIVDPVEYKRLADAISDIDCDGVLLWVDNFDETLASIAELKGFLEFGRLLRNGEREVINVHGGYFSILATGAAGSHAITGVSHGPEFGEYRSVVPVGGGIPIAKYYIPQLHRRERYRDALQVFNSAGWLENAGTFHGNVCNCDECQTVLNGNVNNFSLFGEGTVKSIKRGSGIVRIQYPSTETKMRCLRHYLLRKNLEYQMAGSASKPVLLQDLANSIDAYVESVGLDSVSHLMKWSKVLSEFA